jgi:hypothetical protein
LSANLRLRTLAGNVPLDQFPAFSDPFACALVLQNKLPEGVTVQVGQWFFYKRANTGGGGSSILDGFKNLVTAGLKVAGLVVTSLPDLYNGAVDAVKGLAYDVLVAVPGISDLCKENPGSCEKAIAAGMTYGMMAMGLPPSVPNWDELKDEGIEYLAQEVGDRLEEETAVPSSVTEYALKEVAQKAVTQMTDNRNAEVTDPAFSWIVPYFGFNPASLTIALQKNGLDPLPPMILRTFETDLFRGKYSGLPSRFPASGTLRVPVVLHPNLDGIPPPFCFSSMQQFPPRQCVPNPVPFIIKTPTCAFEVCQGWECVWHDDPNCQNHGEMVQAYYRDAWVQSKMDAVPCTTVAAATLGQAGWQMFPLPGLTTFIGATVQPSVPLTWNGAAGTGCTIP